MGHDQPNTPEPFDVLRSVSLSSQDFAQRLNRSGLVDKDAIQKAWKGLAESERSPAGLAKALSTTAKLTPFQALRLAEDAEAMLVLDNYVIQDKLGEGGMGQVFRAVHRKMKREVALKVISSSVLKDDHAIARFNREVEAAAKLSHPHIISAFDAGESNGIHYLVMEYIVGIDLSSRVRSRGPMPLTDAVQATLQAARGLAYAHSQGIVHRDIKPSNLLIDRKGIVRVLDLGLARIDQTEEASALDGLTSTGVVMGTVDYMAPEQAMDSKAADARSDIYSLGCTFFFLVTGRSVFSGDTLIKRLLAHRDQPVPPLTKYKVPATPRLEAIFAKMLAKRPAERFQSMEDVVHQLEAVLPELTVLHPDTKVTSGHDPTLSLAASPLAGLRDNAPAPGGFEPTVALQPAANDTSLEPTLVTAAVDDTLKIQDQLALIGKSSPHASHSQMAAQRVARKPKRSPWRTLAAAATAAGLIAAAGYVFLAGKSNDNKLANTAAISPAPSPSPDLNESLGNDLPTAATNTMPSAMDEPSTAEAERRAAEWLSAAMVTGRLGLRMQDGSLREITTTERNLPDDRFSIESIDFIGGEVDDTGLEHVSHCRHLKEVAFRGTTFFADMTSLTWLREATQLESLVFESTPVNNSLWGELAHWPALRHLRIADSETLSDPSSIPADIQPPLESLELARTSLDNDDVTLLVKRFPAIKRLDVGQKANESLRSLSVLAQLPELTHLGCSPNQLSGEGVALIAQCPRLSSLEIDGPIATETLAQIAGLRDQLDALSITTSEATTIPFTSESYRELAGYSKLASLRLRGGHGSPTDADLLFLASLPQLCKLDIVFDPAENSTDSALGRKYTSAGVEAFRNLRPDIDLAVDGESYAASAAFGSIAIPSAPPIVPAPDPAPQPVDVPANTPDATLASSETRLAGIDIPASASARRMWKVAEPLGAFAAVTRPARLAGVASWSVEPIRHRGAVTCIDASSQGLVASGGSDTTVRVWTADGKLIRVLAGHFNNVASVAFSPDGKRLASVSVLPQSQLAIWNVDNGALVKVISTANWHGRLSWSNDGKRLAHAASNQLEIYDTTTWAVVRGERSYAYPSEIAWSPDDSRVFLGSAQESSGSLIDLTTMRSIREVPCNGGVTSSSWSRDGRFIAIGHRSGVMVVETRSFNTVQAIDGISNAGVEFSPDSTMIGISSDEGLRLFSTKDWSDLKIVGQASGPDVCWSHDGERLLSAGGWYEPSTKKILPSPMASGTHQVRLAVAPNGRRIVTKTRYRFRLWDGDSGQLLQECETPPEHASQMAWQPGGNLFFQIVQTDNEPQNRLQIVDGDSGRVVQTMSGHSETIWSAAWSPDGRHLASVSDDGTCRLWNVQSGETLKTLAHGDPLWWIVWSTDSTRLATGSAFSAISVWDVKEEKLLQTFKTLSENLLHPNSKSYTDDAPFAFTRDPNQICVSAKSSSFELLNVTHGTIAPLGNVTLRGGGGGTPYGIHWTNEYRSIGVVTSYRELNLYTLGSQEGFSIFHFMAPHWLEDGRRVVGGDNHSTNVYGIDLRNNRRLGTLLPEMQDNAWAAISHDGHIQGSEGLANHIAMVAVLADGRVFTMTPDEFASQFKWKNEITRVRFLK